MPRGYVCLFFTLFLPLVIGGCTGSVEDLASNSHKPGTDHGNNKGKGKGNKGDTGDEGNPTTPGQDPGGGTLPDTTWYDDAYQFRRLIIVEAKEQGIPENYSHSITVDHQALVAAGQARSDGDDLRIICEGQERDRVLDDMTSWNTENTRLWFKLPVSVEAFAFYSGCFLYHGNESSGTPPTRWVNGMGADGESYVFVAGDDFAAYENNSKAPGWTEHGGADFRVAHDDAGGWLRLVDFTDWSEGVRATALEPQGDAAWSVRLHYWQEGTNAWGGLGVRSGEGGNGAVVAIRDGGWLHTNPAFSGGAWQSNPSVHFPLGSQGRLEVRTYGDKISAVWHNPAGFSPATVTLFTDAHIAAESGGLDVYVQAPGGGNNRWIDATNVIVRKYVHPNPELVLGAPESILPGWIDTTPPQISGGEPSGVLPSGTTEVTVSVLTDKLAQCRWGASLQSFDDLPNVFQSSNGLFHEDEVKNLEDGGEAYTIYVLCKDGAGNISEAYSFSFEVAEAIIVPVGTVDPTLLPVATTAQVPLTAAYNALNVPSLPVGGFYLDPTTGAKIYRVTNGSFPTTASSWHHDYADGGDEVSLPYDGNTRALLVRHPNGTHWLVDFTPGVGVSNPRALTGSLRPVYDLSFTFSNNPDTPYYAYVANGSSIRRFDIRTMQEAPGNGWPVLSETNGIWLHASERDGMFVWMRGAHGPTIVMYEPSTGTKKTYTNSNLNEPRIDRAGRYVGICMSSPQNALLVWDWNTNSIIWSTGGNPGIPFAHNASLKRRWVTVDWNSTFPTQFATFTPNVPNSGQRVGGPAPGHLVHGSGNWIQHPENLDDQWSVFSHYGSLQPSTNWQWLAPGGLILMTPAGERRLLAHPYNTTSSYHYLTFAKFSPDGRYVMFTSNMNGAGRSDVFLAELPEH